MLLSIILLTAIFGVKPSAAQTKSWVGYTSIDEVETFIRIGPQVFAGPELYFHDPNALIFNQNIENFSVSATELSFNASSQTVEQPLAFAGTFDGEKYVGTVLADGISGSFNIHPVATSPNTSTLASYSGTYEIADNVYRTVGFEDVAGLVETRLYYSNGNDFVLMYPLSSTEFMTSMGERIQFNRKNGAISGMTISIGSDQIWASKVSHFNQVEVNFDNNGAAISGTLMIPNSPGPHPAVIIAHSSVSGERHAYWMFATQFARDGIAVLVYDRRGHGASTGGGPFNLNTNVLAADMKAGYDLLQTYPNIDPHRIGLMGFSNGSWVAPLASQDLPDLAFLSVSMASAVSQVAAELFRRETVLRTVGVSDEAFALAIKALKLYYRGSVEGFSQAERVEFTRLYHAILENKELKAAQGFRILPTDQPLDQIFAAGGSMKWMDYSPANTYRSIRVPVAFHIGELDENISPDLSLTAMRNVIAQRPHADISLVVHTGATHGLFVLPKEVHGISQDVLYPNLASFEFAPGYIDQLRAWLREKAGVPHHN